MTLAEKVQMCQDNGLKILTCWCPKCDGQIVVHPWPRDLPPLACLDCHHRMTYAEPVYSPGSTISWVDWSRATSPSSLDDPPTLEQALRELKSKHPALP